MTVYMLRPICEIVQFMNWAALLLLLRRSLDYHFITFRKAYPRFDLNVHFVHGMFIIHHPSIYHL